MKDIVFLFADTLLSRSMLLLFDKFKFLLDRSDENKCRLSLINCLLVILSKKMIGTWPSKCTKSLLHALKGVAIAPMLTLQA